MKTSLILTLSCIDRVGIVAAVTGALARAVRWFAERRLFLNGQRTIIFR